MRKRATTAWILVLVFVLAMALTACGGKGGESTPPPAQTAAPATPAPSQAPAGEPTAEPSDDGEMTDEELSNHEIYKHLDNNALMGVTPPIMNDRSGIYKALDKVEQKSNVVIGWSMPTLSNNWFAGVKTGAEQYCEEYGYDLRFLVATDFDSVKQSNDVEDFITQGIDVLVLDPCDFQAQEADVRKCIEAGIPVISIGAFGEQVPVVTIVSPLYYWSSFQAGQYAAKQFEEPIEMLLIPGELGNAVSNTRMNGLISGWVYGKQEMRGEAKPYKEDAMLEGFNYYNELVDTGKIDMSKYDAKVVGSANGYFSEEGGMTATEDLLTANPNVSLILTCNDHIAAGAIKVIEQRGLSGKILVGSGVDGETSTLNLLKDGKLLCTGYNNPIGVSKAIVELIHMIFEEGYDANNMPIYSSTVARLWTKDNYQEIYDPNTEYSKIIDVEFKTIDEINAERAK